MATVTKTQIVSENVNYLLTSEEDAVAKKLFSTNGALLTSIGFTREEIDIAIGIYNSRVEADQ